jgi:hypothetical protein
MKRKSGFYWVNIDIFPEGKAIRKWTIAEYNEYSNDWCIPDYGNCETFTNDELNEIDECRIEIDH